MKRREFVYGATGTGLLIVSGGLTWLLTREPVAARKPWVDAGTFKGDRRINWLSYAILAPNPHNRQPWKIKLEGDDGLTLTCDLDKRLPETDPFDRQITIGLGAFLEILRIAAAEDGYETNTVLFPEGESHPRLDRKPIARVTFGKLPKPHKDELFKFIPLRRTNRTVYDSSRNVSENDLTILKKVNPQVDVINNQKIVEALRELTYEAFEIEFRTPETLKESVDLYRIGKKEIETNPDGISLSGPFLESLAVAEILTRKNSLDTSSTSFAKALEIQKKSMMSSMAYIFIQTEDNSRFSQIEAGRLWVRVNLQATSLGIAIQPLSQALQEFSQMSQKREELRTILKVANSNSLQMFARLGYAESVDPSPRWPILTRVI